jgi:hypothetical protein
MNIPVDYAAPCQSAQLRQRFGAAVVCGLGSGEEVRSVTGGLPSFHGGLRGLTGGESLLE